MKTNLPYMQKLDHKLPKEVRVEVYKKAFEIIELGRANSSTIFFTSQLCLLLPCILWSTKSYLSKPEIGGVQYDWVHRDTQIAFPEVTDDYIVTVESIRTQHGKDLYRLQCLNKWVAQLEKEIQ